MTTIDDLVATLRGRYRLRDERVLTAMQTVRRDRFIPEDYAVGADAYGDHPCPIGQGQTISQPYIVAHMTERLAPMLGERVLEIGTGSGYQAAVLAAMGAQVFGVEILPELAAHARRVLDAEGFGAQVRLRIADGRQGWPEEAPFDAVIVTCAPAEVPDALLDQLREGGRLIAPLGVDTQRLVMLRKSYERMTREDDIAVRFVPMVGVVPATA